MRRQEQVKSNGGFIAAIVCSLIAMGGAGALALSRLPTVASPLSGTATSTSFDGRDIKQAGHIVGLGLGAKMISDAEIEFIEIKNAGELSQAREFEFSGHTWRLVRVRELVSPSAAEPGTSMLRAVAKLIR
jgi:hypothetical protein